MSSKAKRARIFVDGEPAGELSLVENQWTFRYWDDYKDDLRPISLLMPVKKREFTSFKLFSYFEGLFVEGYQKALMDRELGEQTILNTLVHRCSHGIGYVQIGPWDKIEAPTENFQQLSPGKNSRKKRAKVPSLLRPRPKPRPVFYGFLWFQEAA